MISIQAISRRAGSYVWLPAVDAMPRVPDAASRRRSVPDRSCAYQTRLQAGPPADSLNQATDPAERTGKHSHGPVWKKMRGDRSLNAIANPAVVAFSPLRNARHEDAANTHP